MGFTGKYALDLRMFYRDRGAFPLSRYAKMLMPFCGTCAASIADVAGDCRPVSHPPPFSLVMSLPLKTTSFTLFVARVKPRRGSARLRVLCFKQDPTQAMPLPFEGGGLAACAIDHVRL